MPNSLKVHENGRDDDIGIMRKNVTLPNNTHIETPTVSLKSSSQKNNEYLMVNEITRRITPEILDSLEEESSRFVMDIENHFLKDKLNLTLFDFRSDKIPDEGKLRTFASCLYSASHKVIVLPTVKNTSLLQPSEESIKKYVNMMQFLINELASIHNGKVFIGTIPLMPIKFVRPLITMYHDKGITSFAIDAGLKDLFNYQFDFIRILLELNTISPLAETMIYACNLGIPQFNRDEIRADDFLSVFAYVDILGTTFKSKGRSENKMKGAIAKAIPTTEQRAKIFKRDRYAYQVTSYAKLYDTLGKQTPLALKNRNRFQQLVETQDIRTIIGKESIKSVLKNKPAVDELALQRLESIAKLKTKISD